MDASAKRTIKVLRREIDLLSGQKHDLEADLREAEERADRYESALIELGAAVSVPANAIEAAVSELHDALQEHGR